MTGEPTVPVPIPDLLAAKGGHVPPIDPIRLRAIEHLIGVLQERARTATTRTIEVEAFSVLTVVDGTEDLIRGVRDLAARVETLEKALDQASTNLAVRSPDESRDDTTVGYQARLWKAALLAGWGGPLGFPFDDAGQSTTETPS